MLMRKIQARKSIRRRKKVDAGGTRHARYSGKLILRLRTFVAHSVAKYLPFSVGVANTLDDIGFFHFANDSIFVADTPLSPMGPSSPSQEGLFTDLRLVSLEKQLNIELKVDAAC